MTEKDEKLQQDDRMVLNPAEMLKSVAICADTIKARNPWLQELVFPMTNGCIKVVPSDIRSIFIIYPNGSVEEQ